MRVCSHEKKREKATVFAGSSKNEKVVEKNNARGQKLDACAWMMQALA